MAIKSGFFNSVTGDRKYDAEDLNKFFDGVITDGVLSAIGDSLEVVPSSGMQIAAGSGKAWFLKSWIENTADSFLTLSDADVTFGRIDIIALDFDKSDQVRENDIVIVEGTPSGTPTPPSLIDTSTHLQKPLAHIQVDANETLIQSSDITSKIDTVDCPYSTGIVDLIVEVDNVTIQIVANELSVKDNGITATQIALSAVGSDQLATNAVTGIKIAADAVNTSEIAASAVNNTELAADAVTGTKIASNTINSEHYIDGSIDREHLEADIIDASKLASNVVNSEHYVDLSIDRVHLAADIIDGTKIANDVINSEHYVAGSIDNEHIANDAINSEHYADLSIDRAHLSNDIIDGSKLAHEEVNSEHYVPGSIDREHIGIDQVNSEHYYPGSIDHVHLAANVVDDDNIGNRVPMLTRRQGGDSVHWSQDGSTNYTPTTIKMQLGQIYFGSVIDPDTSKYVDIIFPQAFSARPIVFVTNIDPASERIHCAVDDFTITASGCRITGWNFGVSPKLAYVAWLAIGPE